MKGSLGFFTIGIQACVLHKPGHFGVRFYFVTEQIFG